MKPNRFLLTNFRQRVFVLVIAMPWLGWAENKCDQVFVEKKTRSEFNLPTYVSYVSGKNRNKFIHLGKSDSRFAVVRIIDASLTMDLIDNLSSPALIKTQVLNPKKSEAFSLYLSKKVKGSRHLITALGEQGQIPEHIKILAEIVESRYRAAIEIIGQGRKEKFGGANDVTLNDYSSGLLNSFLRILRETAENKSYQDTFSDFKIDSVDWSLIQTKIATSMENDSIIDFQIPSKNTFKDDFLNMLGVEGNLVQQVFQIGQALGAKLESTKVGISYRILDMTGTVRFGDLHFYGNWDRYHVTDRQAYLKRSDKNAGTMEVELRVSNKKKKMMATLLDRSHRELDPIFSLSEFKGRFTNTCGLYANLMFIRSGVPIVSPTYLTPTPAIASLALQKALGFKNVEDFRLHDFSTKNLGIAIPVIALHDGGGVSFEINVFFAKITAAGVYIYSLFDEDDTDNVSYLQEQLKSIEQSSSNMFDKIKSQLDRDF